MNEKKVPDEQDQILFLHNKLAGHEAFARLRGQLPLELGILGTILKASESPSDFCSRWDQFHADTRVVGNMLACFKRDGWEAALKELSRALNDKTYRLPGEVVPLHETEPVTIVVFDFQKTLDMIRWIRCANWGSLDQHLDELDNVWSQRYKDPKDAERQLDWWINSLDRLLTQKLFAALPKLLQHTRERRAYGDYEGKDLVRAYREHVLNNFEHVQLREIGRPLSLAHNTYNDHLELYEGIGNTMRLGYICRADQEEILSRFSRDQQTRIATWTVRLPKVHTNFDNLFVGFHPEEFHEKWKSEAKHSTSIGCSNGYGVVVMKYPYATPLHDHTCRHHESVSISQVALAHIDEKLSFELDVKR